MAPNMAWLKCSVSPGQFSEEYAISGIDYKDVHFSLFVNKSFVQHDCPEVAVGTERLGMVSVEILDQENTLALVRLPGRTFENGSTVTVKCDQLELFQSSHL